MIPKKLLATLALAAGFALTACSNAEAKHHRGMKGGMKGDRGSGMKGKGSRQMEPRAPYAWFEEKGLFATGLEADFPEGVRCPEISSPYGSKTRYDGSSRNNSHHGYHNGMDISLDEGTPLLAVADGTVVARGTAGQLVGNYIRLHFRPEDTGLKLHLFARYQHLDRVPDIAVGAKIKAGQEVATSGLTGTQGGHFGAAGYPHLHIVYRTSRTGDHRIKGAMIGPDSLKFLDPLGVYLTAPPEPLENHALRNLPADKKRVMVPAMVDGSIVPAGRRTVWPVACQR